MEVYHSIPQYLNMAINHEICGFSVFLGRSADVVEPFMSLVIVDIQ